MKAKEKKMTRAQDRENVAITRSIILKPTRIRELQISNFPLLLPHRLVVGEDLIKTVRNSHRNTPYRNKMGYSSSCSYRSVSPETFAYTWALPTGRVKGDRELSLTFEE